MSQAGHEYEYKISWLVIAACAYCAFFAIANAIRALGAVFHLFPMGIYGPVGWSLWALLWIPLGFTLARHTLRMVVNRLGRCRRIKLTETDIVVPICPWSLAATSVPYERITKISCMLWMDRKTINVRYARNCFSISEALLPTSRDADEILRVLCEKTSLTFPPPIRWPRQFSLASMFLVMTVLAVLLGICMWIDPVCGWKLLCGIIGMYVAMAFVVWLFTSAPWWARVFAVGCLLGVILEQVATDYCYRHNLTQYAAGTFAPMGWYPLHVPIERMLIVQSGAIGHSWTMRWRWAWLIGSVASGILCGILALALWSLARYVTRQRRRGAKPQAATDQ
jgi:hypothetical protein